MYKMISSNKLLKTLLSCVILLLVANLVSSSSLRHGNNNVGTERSYTKHHRHLQSDGQQSASPSGGSDSGSTLVIVGAVGAVISILILIGGVCYAKRQYNSDQKGPGRRQYLSDTAEDKDISNIISSMEKNAAKKEKGGGGGYFKRSNSKVPGEGETYTNTNGRAAALNDEEIGYESDAPPPPPEHDEQTWDDESDVHSMTNNGIGAGNKSVADHTTGDDDMSYAFSVDQSSIAPYNRQPNNSNSIDPFIGGAAVQSFKNEKGGVFEWNEDGTKMVYTPAVGDDEKKAQNGFVYDEQKMKWVVSKQVVGAKGVSFNPTTSANDGKKSAMMKSPKELLRTHSDASSKSYGSGTTGNSDFTFNAVGSDYSTVRTRSGTTFVSTGIAIPSPQSTAGAEEVEVEGVSAIDRLMLLDDREDDLSDGSTDEDDGGESNLGHVAGDLGDDEPGMIIPKKTFNRIGANTIKEDSPFDEGGTARPLPKPVPNFDSSPRHFMRKNRKPSFGRRV